MDKGSQALSDYVFAAKYANLIDGRKETYSEAVDRCLGMHRRRYGSLIAEENWHDLETMMKTKELGGSQRNMQFGGIGVERNHARSYNCAGSYCDRPRFFAEALWLLLCGCGTGFSVQKHHVAKLPALKKPLYDNEEYCPKSLHVVEDSIEGWADALDALMMSYFNEDYSIIFDYSKIRPKGAALSTSSAKAPGPEPLRKALKAVREILDGAIGRQLKTIECYDIVMHASCAVLSGGVRRSATIALFSPDDEEMLTAKSPQNFRYSDDPKLAKNPQRARSNNSAMLLRGGTTFEQFWRFVETSRDSGGEPGFDWVDDLDVVFNPCNEVSFLPKLPDGRSGWQMCNLVTINGTLMTKASQFWRACQNASLLATLQAGYTDFGYLGAVSEEITRNEALIGVSITGMKDSPDICMNPETLQEGMKQITRVNQLFAEKIGIRPAARCGVIKPEGTTSKLWGTAAGCHERHAHQTIVSVRAGKNEEPAQAFAAMNPDCVIEAEGGWILRFPVEAPPKAKVRAEATAISQLEDVVMIQKAWIEPGTVRGALKNSVSNTITVNPEEWNDAARFIYDHRDSFTGVSLLPSSGDLDYDNAPYVSCDEPERGLQRAVWVTLYSALKTVDYSGLTAAPDTSESACAGGACVIG